MFSSFVFWVLCVVWCLHQRVAGLPTGCAHANGDGRAEHEIEPRTIEQQQWWQRCQRHASHYDISGQPNAGVRTYTPANQSLYARRILKMCGLAGFPSRLNLNQRAHPKIQSQRQQLIRPVGRYVPSEVTLIHFVSLDVEGNARI